MVISIGLDLVRLTVTLCFVLAALRLFAGPLHLALEEWPPRKWMTVWLRPVQPGHFGTDRAKLEAELQQLPGKQLVIVRYAQGHNVLNEWVYNAADINNSRVIWAREMDASSNLEIIHYYKDRHVWMVQPDAGLVVATPYPVIEHEGL